MQLVGRQDEPGHGERFRLAESVAVTLDAFAEAVLKAQDVLADYRSDDESVQGCLNECARLVPGGHLPGEVTDGGGADGPPAVEVSQSVAARLLKEVEDLKVQLSELTDYVDHKHHLALYEVSRVRHSIAGLKAHATRRRNAEGQ